MEAAQKDSRNPGKLMFVKSRVLSSVKDYAIRFYTIKEPAKNISKIMEG